MANITNSQATSFCNEKARPLSDLISTLDRTIDQFLLDVVRDFENLTGGNTTGDLIEDRTNPESRTLVYYENVAQLKYVAEQLKACINVDDRRALVNKWVTNGRPLY